MFIEHWLITAVPGTFRVRLRSPSLVMVFSFIFQVSCLVTDTENSSASPFVFTAIE